MAEQTYEEKLLAVAEAGLIDMDMEGIWELQDKVAAQKAKHDQQAAQQVVAPRLPTVPLVPRSTSGSG
jgi:hypothetical protein